MLPSCGAHCWTPSQGDVPCSPGSLRAAEEPVSPVATLSESEVCFSCDSRCRRSRAGTLSAAPSNSHCQPFVPPAQGWDVPGAGGAPFAFPSSGEHHEPHRAAVRMGRIPHVAPGARGSLGPVFPMLSPSSPTQPLGRVLRNHHLIQVHLARHRWGGGGFHPTHCRTAGFLYHLRRQPPVATQNGSEHQGCFPWLSTLPPHHQSWAEPQGERSWLLQDRTACRALLRTQTSFAGFVRDTSRPPHFPGRHSVACPGHVKRPCPPTVGVTAGFVVCTEAPFPPTAPSSCP